MNSATFGNFMYPKEAPQNKHIIFLFLQHNLPQTSMTALSGFPCGAGLSLSHYPQAPLFLPPSFFLQSDTYSFQPLPKDFLRAFPLPSKSWRWIIQLARKVDPRWAHLIFLLKTRLIWKGNTDKKKFKFQSMAPLGPALELRISVTQRPFPNAQFKILLLC